MFMENVIILIFTGKVNFGQRDAPLISAESEMRVKRRAGDVEDAGRPGDVVRGRVQDVVDIGVDHRFKGRERGRREPLLPAGLGHERTEHGIDSWFHAEKSCKPGAKIEDEYN
jgi:hypothetical protein